MTFKFDVWAEPDYQKEFNEGQEKSKEVLLWKKLVRDSIPINSRKSNDTDYRNFITTLKREVEAVHDKKDCFSLQSWLQKNGYTTQSDVTNEMVVSSKGTGIVNGSMFNIPYQPEELSEMVQNEQFLANDNQKSSYFQVVQLGRNAHLNDEGDAIIYQGNSYPLPEDDDAEEGNSFESDDVENDDDENINDFYAILNTKDHVTEQFNLTKEYAENAVKELADKAIQKDGDYDLPVRGAVVSNEVHGAGELKEDFGFREVKVSDKFSAEESEKVVSNVYQAFESLAKALEITKPSIGLHHTLKLDLQKEQATTDYSQKNQTILYSEDEKQEGCLASAWIEALRHTVKFSTESLPGRIPYGHLEKYSEDVKGACWILDECKRHNCISETLSKNTESYRITDGQRTDLYPKGDERQAINDTFDEWKDKLILKGVLEKPEPAKLTETVVPEPDENVVKKLFGHRHPAESLNQTVKLEQEVK